MQVLARVVRVHRGVLVVLDERSRDDLTTHQRQAIELELSAVAQTGPRRPQEFREAYAVRVEQTMRELITRMVEGE